MSLSEENANEKDSPTGKKSKKFINKFRLDPKVEREKRKQRRSRVIIRNISYKATDETLRQHFAQFGNIVELNLLKRGDGKLVGCAFVQFEKVNEAAKAILKATNKEFLGRPVYVDWAVGKDEFEKRKSTTQVKGEPEEKAEVKTEDEEDMVVDVKEEDASEEEESEEDEEDDSNSEQQSGDESNEDDEDKSEIKSEPNEKKPKRISHDVSEGCTIFIKNVPFEATSDDLQKCCRKFGPIYYALINTEPISGHSKGTGFVKFKTPESADLCLQAGEQFILFGSVMEPLRALSREDVRKQNDAAREKLPSDSRNLYLVKEGLIMAGSKAAETVSAADMKKRHKLEQMKTQILKNLNRFVSRNRLSVHNLPFHYDDEKLKKMVLKFTSLRPHESRVMRENRPSPGHPDGKPKGFGFISFQTHQDALTALRKLNNNPNIFTPTARPIVAFSIEDRSVQKIKEKRLQRSRENNPTYQTKLEKLKQKKNKKKATDSKSTVQKEILQKTAKKETNPRKKPSTTTDVEMADYAGMPSKPGTVVKMRSMRKIREQADEHSKHLSELKRKEKQRKVKRLHRIEKKQIDRPKQGKGKNKADKDHFSNLVSKYKQLIDRRNDESTGAGKGKRSKWYVD